MNIYKSPKSNVYIENTAQKCGICPLCEGKISNWAIAKPSLRPNKIKCNNCGKFVKLAYPKYIFIAIQLVVFIVSLLFVYISILFAVSFVDVVVDVEGDYISNLIKLYLLLSVISVVVVTLMLGFIEAWLFKYRYPFQVW